MGHQGGSVPDWAGAGSFLLGPLCLALPLGRERATHSQPGAAQHRAPKAAVGPARETTPPGDGQGWILDKMKSERT